MTDKLLIIIISIIFDNTIFILYNLDYKEFTITMKKVNLNISSGVNNYLLGFLDYKLLSFLNNIYDIDNLKLDDL